MEVLLRFVPSKFVFWRTKPPGGGGTGENLGANPFPAHTGWMAPALAAGDLEMGQLAIMRRDG